MKNTVFAAVLITIIGMAGIAQAAGLNGSFATSAARIGGVSSTTPVEEQRNKERESLTNCSHKTAARLGMPISSSMRFLPHEQEARCRVETGIVPVAATTHTEMESVKIAEWHKVIMSAPTYLRADARTTGKIAEKPLGSVLLGIEVGTMAEDVPGMDTAKKGRVWTLWNYGGTKIPYSMFERATEYTPVLKTTEVINAKGSRKLVSIQKIDPATEEKKLAEVKTAAKVKETSFFGVLQKIGSTVLADMANGGGSNSSNQTARKVGARETKRDRESMIHEFAGVNLTDVQYMFDQKKGYVGFLGFIADREQFSINDEPPLLADVFQPIIKNIGTPIAVVKTFSDNTFTENYMTVITKDGFRIDVYCVDPGDKTCRKGYVQVRNIEAGTLKAKDVTNFFE